MQDPATPLINPVEKTCSSAPQSLDKTVRLNKSLNLTNKQLAAESGGSNSTLSINGITKQQINSDLDQLNKHVTALKKHNDKEMKALRAEVFYVRARQHQANYYAREAIDFYLQCIALHPAKEKAYQAATDLYLKHDENIGAKKVNDKYLKAFPDSAKAHYQLGEILFKASYQTEAINCVEKTFELTPQEEITGRNYRLLGQLYPQDPYFRAKKQKCFRRAFEKSPDDPVAMEPIISYYYKKTKFKQAVELEQALNSIWKGDMFVKQRINLLQTLFFQLKDYPRVLELGSSYLKEESVINKKDLFEVYRLITACYSRLGQVEEALDLQADSWEKLDNIPKINSHFWGKLDHQQRVALLTKKYNSGKYLKPNTFVNFARLFQREKAYDLAVQAYQEAQRLDRTRGRYDKSIRDEINQVFGRQNDVITPPAWTRQKKPTANIFGWTGNEQNIFEHEVNNNNDGGGNLFGDGPNVNNRPNGNNAPENGGANIFGGGRDQARTDNLFRNAQVRTDNNVFGGRGNGNIFGGGGGGNIFGGGGGNNIFGGGGGGGNIFGGGSNWRRATPRNASYGYPHKIDELRYHSNVGKYGSEFCSLLGTGEQIKGSGK